MPESTTPADAAPPAPPPAPARPVFEEGDLRASPLHMEVIADLNWAYDQYQAGAFEPYLGQYVCIVNRKVCGAGLKVGPLLEDAAQKAGVITARVALFFADDGMDF